MFVSGGSIACMSSPDGCACHDGTTELPSPGSGIRGELILSWQARVAIMAGIIAWELIKVKALVCLDWIMV